MEQQQQKALQRTRLNILENLDVDHIKDHLIQYDVISIDAKEDILSERTRRKRVEVLLDKYLARSRSTDAFEKFCLALAENGYEFIRDSLVDALKTIKEDPYGGDWLAALTEKSRRRRLTELELGRISQNLGANWLILGEELGYQNARLQQYQMQAPYSVPTQILQMLVDWRNSKASEAHVENLVSALRRCNIDEAAYKDIILEASDVQMATPYLL